MKFDVEVRRLPVPGCAVTAAVAEGRLSARRLADYAKLQRELAHREGRQAEHERRVEGRRGELMLRAALKAKRPR